MFSEIGVEEYGYTPSQNCQDNTEVGYPMPGGKERGSDDEGKLNQEGSCASVVADLEIEDQGWNQWKFNWSLDQPREIFI